MDEGFHIDSVEPNQQNLLYRQQQDNQMDAYNTGSMPDFDVEDLYCVYI